MNGAPPLQVESRQIRDELDGVPEPVRAGSANQFALFNRTALRA